MFVALDAGRGSNGFGPNPLAHAEIDAYRRLHDIDLTPFELGCLRALDRERLKAAAEGTRK
jgi:hypothetical protein